MIGSGNVATHLSLALKNEGNVIVQVYSKTQDNARILADKLGADVAANIAGIRRDADAYILSVKDDAIPAIMSELMSEGMNTESVVMHTAGSVSIDVLKDKAAHYGVLYPMQTFSKERAVDFSAVPCFIEANDDYTMGVIRGLAESISKNVTAIDSEKRKRMHLAAVFACNLTNHCYRLAERILEAEGIDFSLFVPLIEETARKVKVMSPKDAQTGPMVRYDRSVMDMQISMLPDERTRNIYRLMAESIHEDCVSE